MLAAGHSLYATLPVRHTRYSRTFAEASQLVGHVGDSVTLAQPAVPSDGNGSPP